MYAVLVVLIAYFAFDIWRPSVLLVGNVTIDVVGPSANPQRLPGGVLPVVDLGFRLEGIEMECMSCLAVLIASRAPRPPLKRTRSPGRAHHISRDALPTHDSLCLPIRSLCDDKRLCLDLRDDWCLSIAPAAKAVAPACLGTGLMAYIEQGFNTTTPCDLNLFRIICAGILGLGVSSRHSVIRPGVRWRARRFKSFGPIAPETSLPITGAHSILFSRVTCCTFLCVMWRSAVRGALFLGPKIGKVQGHPHEGTRAMFRQRLGRVGKVFRKVCLPVVGVVGYTWCSEKIGILPAARAPMGSPFCPPNLGLGSRVEGEGVFVFLRCRRASVRLGG